MYYFGSPNHFRQNPSLSLYYNKTIDKNTSEIRVKIISESVIKLFSLS